MLLFALVRATEIIGEAASRVSPESRTTAPTVPWARITGMRNRLIHAYFDIDHDILWRTAVEGWCGVAMMVSSRSANGGLCITKLSLK